MKSLTWGQVLAWRMKRQMLLSPEAGADPVEVTRRLAGVQAQVASSAVLSIAIRGGTSPADALWKHRTLLKTWAMRGTLHLLPVDEAAAYLALCGTVRFWEKPSWTKAAGATPADLEAMAEVAADVLADAALTREELTAAILDRTGSHHLEQALGSGWGQLFKPLAWWGVLCHGPSQGNKITFTSPASLPGWNGLPEVEDAARTVVSAYLGAHGPATPEMFDNWLIRRMSRKAMLRSWFTGDDLTQVSVDGTPMYALASHLDDLLATEPTDEVRLLGAFDPYILGAGTDAAYLIPPGHRPAVSRAAGWIAPVVLHAGRVAGTWNPANGETTLWEKVPAPALKKAAELYAAAQGVT